jgi:hypothetical protein
MPSTQETIAIVCPRRCVNLSPGLARCVCVTQCFASTLITINYGLNVRRVSNEVRTTFPAELRRLARHFGFEERDGINLLSHRFPTRSIPFQRSVTCCGSGTELYAVRGSDCYLFERNLWKFRSFEGVYGERTIEYSTLKITLAVCCANSNLHQ